MDQLVSYVLSRLAKVADVSPRDVHSSLLNRSITLKNVTLKTDTLNNVLPIPLDRGEIPAMVMHLPNPATAEALRIEIREPRAVFPLDISAKPSERSMEEILKNITLATILGDAYDSDTDEDCIPDSVVNEGDDDFSASTTASIAETELSSVRSDLEDEDLQSCLSEASDSEGSSSSSSHSNGSPNEQHKSGFLSYIRRRATQSFEWIWQRPIEIAISDVTLILPCDAQKGINFEIKVKKFMVQLEPTQKLGAEHLKVVHLSLDGIAVLANTGESAPKVVSVESLGVTITSVLGALSGSVIRKNDAIAIKGAAVIANEASLYALAKCQLTRDIMLAVPPYCRPFTSLRKQRSLWPYTAACVLAKVRDQRTRYNYNLSHLRYYAKSRARYMQLLDDCHRAQSVTERAAELAEAEHDLHFMDVITYLRQTVQDRYTAKIARKRASPALIAHHHHHPTSSRVGELVSSTHVDVDELQVCLPAQTTVRVHEVSVVIRNHEKVISVRNVGIETADSNQQLVLGSGASDGPSPKENGGGTTHAPLLLVEEDEGKDGIETRISIGEVRLGLRIHDIHSVAMPLLEVLQQMGLQERLVVADSTAVRAVSQPAQLQPRRLFCTVPRIQCKLDVIVVLVDHLSVASIASVPSAPPKIGLSLREFSVRSGSSYLIAPVEAHMQPNDDVVVSEVVIAVNADTWAYMQVLRDNFNEIVACIPPQLFASQAIQPSDVPDISYAALEKTRRIASWKHSKSSQEFSIRGVRVSFEPLAATAVVSRILITRTQHANKNKSGLHIRVNHVSGSIAHSPRLAFNVAVEDGVHVYVSPLDAATVITMDTVQSTCEDRARKVTTDLFSAHKTSVTVLHNVTHGAVESISAVEGVAVKPFTFLMKNDLYSTPTVEQPFRGAMFQIGCAVESIDLSRVACVPFPLIAEAGGALVHFVHSELIPDRAYQLFFSSLTDVVANIGMDGCEVKFGDGAYLSLSTPYDSTVGQQPDVTAALRAFGPLLQTSTRPNSICVLNDVRALSMSIELPHFTVSSGAIGADGKEHACIRADIDQLRASVPIQKMAFWSASTRAIPPPPIGVTVGSVSVALGDGTGSCVESPTCRVTVKTVVLHKAVDDDAAAQQRRCSASSIDCSTRGRSPTTDSDRGSSASAEFKERENITLTVRTWNAQVDFSRELRCYTDMVSTCLALTAIPEKMSHETVISDTIATPTEFDLEDCGSIFFHSDTRVILVKSCTFTSARMENCLVICEGTTVVFDKCTFRSTAPASFIRLASEASSVYVCKNCVTLAVPPAPALGSPELAATIAEKAQMLIVNVKKGRLEAKLTSQATVVVTHTPVEVHHVSKRRSTTTQLRLDDLRVDYTEGGLWSASICPKLSCEVDVSHKKKTESLSLNLSVRVSDVYVPLVVYAFAPLGNIIDALQSMTPPRPSSGVARPRLLVVPPPTAGKELDHPSSSNLPLKSWKILCSCTMVSITVALPNSTPVAKLVLSDAFLWSCKDHLSTEATVDGRLALHDLALWEFTSLQCVKTAASPCVLGVQGKLTSMQDIALGISLSNSHIKISTEQLKFLLALASSLNCLSTPCTTLVHNQSGYPVTLRMASGGVVTVEAEHMLEGAEQQLARQPVQVWHGLLVREEMGSNGEGGGRHRSIMHNTALSVTTAAVGFTDGSHAHVTSTLERDFTQQVWFRTMLHIKNETPFYLHFADSATSSVSEATVCPKELSCLPRSLFAIEGLTVSVSAANQKDDKSLRVSFLSVTPQEFLTSAFTQPLENLPVLREEFVFQRDGKRVYLDLIFERCQDETNGVVVSVRPSQPILVNRTFFPLYVKVSTSTRLMTGQRTLIEPGGSLEPYALNPSVSYIVELELTAHGEKYHSDSVVDLLPSFSPYPVPNPLIIPMSSERHPSRPLFSLSADRGCCADGARIAQWSITASDVALVHNNCDTDVVIASADGGPVGTVGEMGLERKGGRASGGYLPLRTGLQLRSKETKFSELFEMEEKYAGSFVHCGHGDGCAEYFVIRPLPTSAFEIVPPLVIVNKDHHRTLAVRHVIKRPRGGSTSSAHAAFDGVTFVPPGSQQGYHTLASGDNVNFFAFCYTESADAAVDGEYSTLMEVNLSPNTTWSGHVRCSNSNRRVDVIKKGLCDTALMVVSKARLPKVRLINTTSTAYAEVGGMGVCTSAASSLDQSELLLTPLDGGSHFSLKAPRVSGVHEVAPDVFLHTRVDLDNTAVIISDLPVLLCDFTPGGESESNSMLLRIDVQIAKQSLKIECPTAVRAHFHLGIDSSSLRLTYAASLASAQCNISGVSLMRVPDKGSPATIVEPFSLGMAVRDAAVTRSAVTISSLQMSCSPISVTISDVLIYQMQQCAEHVAVPNNNKDDTSVSHEEYYTDFDPPRRIYIAKALIAEVPMEVSWDRAQAPPKDYVFRNSPLSMMIPSLHHAKLYIPKLQFKQLSMASAGDLVATVQQILVMEVVKQIPSIVSSVGFFRKNTSLVERITSRVSTLLFGPPAEEEDADNGASASLL